MNFVLYRLLYRRKASQPERRLLGLIDMIRTALPHLEPDRVQPLAAFEPPQQGFLICYPRHEPEGQRLVRDLLKKKGVPFEEHLLGPEPVLAGRQAVASTEDRLEQKSRLMESGRFFAQMGLVDEALPLLQDAVELDPGCVESSQHLVAVLRQLNRNKEAESVLRRALRHKPGTPAFHLLMGTHLLDLGRLEEAVEAFKEGIRLEPRAPVLYAQLGTALYRMGELQQAESAFAEALGRDENLQIALVGMGETLLEQGRLDEAASYLHKSLEDDESPEARLKLGWCHYHLGRLDRAETDFLSAAAEPTDPYWAAARFSLGRLYLERGSLDLAREVLEDVCRREPDFSEAHRFLAETCTLLGDHARALKHWQTVERLEPERSLALQPSMAVCYSRLGRHQEAEACLYGCIDKMGSHPYLFQLLATVMMAQEQWERARDALRVAEQLDPESSSTQFEIAWVEENLGNLDVARERYNRVLRLDPECVEAYSGLGWLYLQEEKLDVALVLFEKCLELRGPDAEVLDTLGWVYMLQGDVPRALSLFESAVAFEPTLGIARAHRAAALAKLERCEEARQELLRAVELDPSDEEVLGYARELAVHLAPLGRQLTRALGTSSKKRGSRVQPKPSASQSPKSWNKVRLQTAASDVDFWEDFPEEA